MISRHEPDTDQLLTSSAGSAISAKDIDREQLAAAMREFESRNGPVATQPIIQRGVPTRLTKPQPPAPQQCDPLLSMEEAAEYLGVSSSWVYRQHTLGTGPQSVKQGRGVKFYLSALEHYKATHPDIREASK